MPIHSPSYRSWEGPRVSEWTRWFTICSTGIGRAFQSRWLRRLLFSALLPLLFFGLPFFLFEQAPRDPEVWQGFSIVLRRLPQGTMLREAIGTIPASPTPEQFAAIRHPVWSFLLLTFLRYPQAFLMVLLIGVVAPPLISQDLRTRAYLIYFARPISRLEYVVGKVGIVGFFLFSISAVPALLLYIAAVLLSPTIDVVLTTWDLPLRIFAASACMIIPTTLVALAFSSLTLESRYAGFAWFAMWIMGHVTYSALVAIPSVEAARDQVVFEPGWRVLASPYQVLGVVQSYAFGMVSDSSVVLPSFLLLIAVSIVSLVVLFQRVAAPMRV
jgi:ABC-2 type transport system permease protein